jgi:hypothetical protein
MKIRFTHMERSVIFYGRGDYVIDTSKFPELEGMSEDDVVNWVYENQEDLGVDFSYNDTKEGRSKANEVVPLEEDNEELGLLSECVSDSSVDWEKFGDEEHYFEARYTMEEGEEDL